MGFSEDSLHLYVARDLRKEFSPEDGWVINRNVDCKDVSFDYLVSRKRYGKTTFCPVDVLISPQVSETVMNDLMEKISRLKEQKILFETPLLIVPSGADTSLVSDDIKVKFLRILKVDNSDIIWWKKDLAS